MPNIVTRTVNDATIPINIPIDCAALLLSIDSSTFNEAVTNSNEVAIAATATPNDIKLRLSFGPHLPIATESKPIPIAKPAKLAIAGPKRLGSIIEIKNKEAAKIPIAVAIDLIASALYTLVIPLPKSSSKSENVVIGLIIVLTVSDIFTTETKIPADIAPAKTFPKLNPSKNPKIVEPISFNAFKRYVTPDFIPFIRPSMMLVPTPSISVDGE